jgi:hypothetical protein
LEPIDDYNIYKVSVYAKSRKSSYFTFCTPEARKHIDLYLDHRKRWGERLADDSPLFRTDFNPQAVDRIVKPISTSRIRHFVTDALKYVTQKIEQINTLKKLDERIEAMDEGESEETTTNGVF